MAGFDCTDHVDGYLVHLCKQASPHCCLVCQHPCYHGELLMLDYALGANPQCIEDYSPVFALEGGQVSAKRPRTIMEGEDLLWKRYNLWLLKFLLKMFLLDACSVSNYWWMTISLSLNSRLLIFSRIRYRPITFLYRCRIINVKWSKSSWEIRIYVTCIFRYRVC